MSFLDTMIYGIRDALSHGVALTRRGKINFLAPLSAVDNNSLGTTDVTSVASTSSLPGSMSAADKAKLDGIQIQGSSVAVSAYAIDWSLGGVFYKTLGAGAQVFTFSNATDGWVVIVVVTGAASTLTWPTVKWPGGVAPTQTASGTDVYTFVKRGTTIYGTFAQAMA